MNFLDHDVAPLGMGCWPIGGAMFSGSQPLGYTGSNDAESIRTIHAALAAGITVFDTAAAYGAGHAERILAQALADRPEAIIVTKIGLAIDETTRQLTGDETDPARVLPAIDAGLRRLGRAQIDLVLLHPNETPLPVAEPIFEQIEIARQAGKIRAYGWSTDFTDRAAALAPRAGFRAVEHAMNVLVDAPRMQKLVQDTGMAALIRSPLGMGLLSGKYDAKAMMPADDIRATGRSEYFPDARPDPAYLAQLEAVRALLTTGGRSLVQGALGWIWAKGERNLPVPGARNVAQIEGIAGALAHGPLPLDVMAQIEDLIPREAPDRPDRPR